MLYKISEILAPKESIETFLLEIIRWIISIVYNSFDSIIEIILTYLKSRSEIFLPFTQNVIIVGISGDFEYPEIFELKVYIETHSNQAGLDFIDSWPHFLCFYGEIKSKTFSTWCGVIHFHIFVLVGKRDCPSRAQPLVPHSLDL